MLKSMFITAYIMLAIIIAINSGRALTSQEFLLGNVGLLFTTVPVGFLLVRLMVLKNRSLTDGALKSPLLIAVLGFSLTIYSWLFGAAPVDMVTVAGVMALSSVFYVYWYSRLDRAAPVFAVGESLPTFTLESSDGLVLSSETLDGTPAVLIFYRGNWCPLCMAQVKEMAASYNQLKAMGARVVFVSPQPQSYTAGLAKKFGTDGLEFMRDGGNSAAKILGINARFGTPMGMQVLGYSSHTVLPTVIIIDASGTVIWTHETDNYRVRPEPETYLAVLKEAGIKAA